MNQALYIAAALQIAAGGYVLTVAKSTFHETTAAVAIGAGVITLALARLVQIAEAHEARIAEAERKARVEEYKARKIA